jgi:crotonobetainyl-CoA:carnitine CoA-transferase CaiB-like acyl-CoA transferase
VTQHPLHGKTVIELGTMVAAPFATHILAQLGAKVIKIEPPSGDTTRNLVRGGPSGTFIAYNHGKKSLCIDLASPAGGEVFRRLVAKVDAVVHNLSPSAARKLGVTAEALAPLNPELIVCHISGYSHGPLTDELATNPVAEAATGVMDDHRIDGRPSRLGPSYHDQFAGCYAVIRILSTWLNPAAPPQDRKISVGLYETGLHVAARDLAGVQLKTQLLGRPEKEAGGEFAMPGYGAYQTADARWVYLLVLTDAHWAKLTRALEMPEGDEVELSGLRERKKQRARVEAAVRHAVIALAFDAAAEKFRAEGLGFTEVLPLERVLESAQAHQPGKLRTLEYRGLRFDVPEFPGQLDTPEGSSPPELGEHSDALLSSLGYTDSERADLLATGAVEAAKPGRFAYAPMRERKSAA